MKHLIKGDGYGRAHCQRPGCIASLEGGDCGKWSQEQYDKFFGSDCPGVHDFKTKIHEAPFEERVAYLIKYAKKEIKDWQNLIKYWEEQLKEGKKNV